MEHLEIEFKMLLEEKIFKKILLDYQNQIKDSYEQTNYYLFHPLLAKNRYTLRIREKKGRFELTLKRPAEIGTNELNIDIDKEGKDILIGFNPRFLIDALKVIDDETISIYLVNPKAPCFIRDDEENYTYLILPVNINQNQAR